MPTFSTDHATRELRFAQIGEAAPSVIDPLAFAVGGNYYTQRGKSSVPLRLRSNDCAALDLSRRLARGPKQPLRSRPLRTARLRSRTSHRPPSAPRSGAARGRSLRVRVASGESSGTKSHN